MRADVVDQFADPALPELAYQLDGTSSRGEALDAAVELLMGLIPCQGLCWNLVDRISGNVEVVGKPAEQFAGSEELLLELDDHPMILSYLDAAHPLGIAPRRISDLVEIQQFHRTRTYNDLFRPLSVEHMLTVLTYRMTPAMGRCFTFVRGPGADFSDGNLDLAARLQHVLRAFDLGLTALPVASPAEEPGAPTRRELQVGVLAARGLTAQASAHALRVSPRTVQKHLQNLYAKLGTNDRVTAINELRRRRLIP